MPSLRISRYHDQVVVVPSPMAVAEGWQDSAWKTVKDVIGTSLQGHFTQLADGSAPWPCDLPAAQTVKIKASGTLGQIAMTRAFAIGRPTGVSVVGLSQVAFAVIFDIVIWGRVFDPLTVIGLVLP